MNGKYNDTTTPAVIEVLEGLPVILTCPLIGHPHPNFNWYRKDNDNGESNKLLPENNENIRVMNAGKFLNILQSSIEDTGVFSCVAKNAAGERSFSFNVTVLGMCAHILN